jgi:plastocyanin
VRFLVVPLLVLALAGCGGDDGTPAGTRPAPEEARQTFVIELSEFRLDPSRLTIDEPGVYTFRAVNEGSTMHALELQKEPDEEHEFEASIGTLEPGESAELTVRLERGTYELQCPVGDHDERGMEGVATVGGAPAGTTTKDDDEDDGYGGYGDR